MTSKCFRVMSINLIAEPLFVFGAEPRDVYRIFAYQPFDFLFDAVRVGVLVGFGIRRQKAAHIDALYLPRRIAGRHPHTTTFWPFAP